jgi:hypothetical protein
MKKKQTKKVIAEKSKSPESHLIEAANILITEFKKPANLLEFLTRSFYWLECYSIEKKSSFHQLQGDINLNSLAIERLVLAWLKKDVNMVYRISEGIKSIWNFSLCTGYFEYLSIIIQGFGLDVSQGQIAREDMKKFLSAMNTMQEIGYCIETYECEINKIKRQSNLSEAA